MTQTEVVDTDFRSLS